MPREGLVGRVTLLATLSALTTCASPPDAPEPGGRCLVSRADRAASFLLRLGPLPAGRARLELDLSEGWGELTLEARPVAPVSFFVDRSLRMRSRFARPGHETLVAESVDRRDEEVRRIRTVPEEAAAAPSDASSWRVERLPTAEARDPLSWLALLLAHGPEQLLARSPAPVAAFGRLRWIEVVRTGRQEEQRTVDLLLKREPTAPSGRRIRLYLRPGADAVPDPSALRRVEIETSIGSVVAEPESR